MTAGPAGGRSERGQIVEAILYLLRGELPWLRHVFADGSYASDKLRTTLAKIGTWTLEIIKRSDRAKGFKLLPRR